MSNTEGNTLPEGLITFYAGTDGRVPAGWEEYQPAQGRMILATKNSSLLGLCMGTAISPGGIPQHSHAEISGVCHVPSWGTSTVDGEDQDLGASGVVPLTGALDQTSTGHAFFQLLVIRSLGHGHSGSGGDAMPYDSLAFFDQAPPEEDWDIVEADAGYFILPNNDLAEKIGVPWNPEQPPGHDHTVVGAFTMNTIVFGDGVGSNQGGANNSEAVALGTAGALKEPVVPYVCLYLCRKKTMASAGFIPLGVTLFINAGSPPEHWGLVSGSENRFLIGLPAGGEQGDATGGEPNGATAIHLHNGEAKVAVPNFPTDLDHIGIAYHLGEAGAYSVLVESSIVSITLPSITAMHCIYNGP